MNAENKPVAWRCKKFYETQEGWFYNENQLGEPLYTHPIKEYTPNQTLGCSFDLAGFKPPVKELTDDEILVEWDWRSGLPFEIDLIEFARAILQKASEK